MIVAIVQARMSSTRLPGKVMAPILGEPMILRLLERARRAKTLTNAIVATSSDPSDEPLAALLKARNCPVFRGDLHDVLGRYAAAARSAGEPTHVVRLTADCPLIDPSLIDDAVRLALASGADYAGNVARRTFPQGLEVEVVRTEALYATAAEAADPAEREDVALFLRRRPERFTAAHLTGSSGQAKMCWAVDGPADFAFVRAVYEALHPANPAFNARDVHNLLEARPELDPRGAPPLADAA